MKKYNLLKVIGITILLAWLLTFFIPGSQFDYSGSIVKGDVAPIGIWGLLSDVSISISYFSSIAVLLIAIAVFYGVLSKLDVYNNFVEKTSKNFESKPGTLVIVSVIFFGVLSALVSDSMLLFVFVPFIYQIMKKNNIDSKVILSSTIVAGLIGSISRIYDSNIFDTFKIETNTLLLVKLIVLVLNLFALIMIITPRKKNGKRVDNKSERKVSESKIPEKKAAPKKGSNSKPQSRKKTSGRRKA